MAASHPPVPPNGLIILPLRTLVLFPGIALPITAGRMRSRAGVEEAIRSQLPLGLLLERDPAIDDPGPSDLYGVGTAATILRFVADQEGGHLVVCQGQQRFSVVRFLEGYPFLVAEVDLVTEVETSSPEIEAQTLVLRQQAREVLSLLPTPPELAAAIDKIESPSSLADMVAALLDLKPPEKQAILETFDLRQRLDKVLRALGHSLQVLKLSREIASVTSGSL